MRQPGLPWRTDRVGSSVHLGYFRTRQRFFRFESPVHAPRGAQRCYNALEENDDSASLCLAGQIPNRHARRSLAAVQPRFLG